MSLASVFSLSCIMIYKRRLSDSSASLISTPHIIIRVFIEASANINDARLRLLAALAFLYAGVRFIEAYGLWRG